ncbi:MAG: hypothetical protein FJW80_06385 [Actinobacteria bacterium]|nr:hypothetical protein [Actinomycetota bacterium]
MDLNNSFVVPADLNTAWRTLLDVEAIAPCMPGATLESVHGDDFTGSVKVKLGPVNMTYGGKARFLEKNEVEHKAVIEGTGKETRGSGTASALVTCQLVCEGPNQTRVDVVTDLTVTGKPAQFGRGVMQDVAGRIIEQFSANLAATMAAGAAASCASDSTGSATPAQLPQVADSIDLLGTAGTPVLKRAIPALIAVVALIGIIWLIARRRG